MREKLGLKQWYSIVQKVLVGGINVYLNKKKLRKMEEYYYWTGKKRWVSFPKELKNKLLENYGAELYPNE